MVGTGCEDIEPSPGTVPDVDIEIGTRGICDARVLRGGRVIVPDTRPWVITDIRVAPR